MSGRPPTRVGQGRFDARMVRQRRPKKTPRDWLGHEGMTPDSLRATMLGYLESLQVRHYSAATVDSRARDFRLFVAWCEERALARPAEVTKRILERYQRHLFYFRKPNGQPLSVERQHVLLVQLRMYFRWLCRENFLPANPASELELPRQPLRLPRDTLTVPQVEKLLAVPNVETLVGLRDRALLELLWATGLRRAEACNVSLYDVSFEKGTVFVREGKWKKDRVVPLPQRAADWLARYLRDVRPRLASFEDDGAFFLSEAGGRMSTGTLTQSVRAYLRQSGFKGRGSSHLLRHACATALLEGGADVRFVQELLGHASLETTQVYTRVSIVKLKEVYEACHPAARPSPTAAPTPATTTADDVLAQLELEDEDEGEDADEEMG
ncbi:MAG: site-specific tyrosine recombinase XerC [Myxococcaceae bacterium]|nr:site-specific tyrosine recombinase XerC [Myxococcaceae bacterium]